MDVNRLTSLFGLEGRRAVVTGGSRGIGRMIAEGLLDAGCEVIITARKVEQVTAAADEMSAKGTVIAVPSDLSTDEGIAHLAAAVPDGRCERKQQGDQCIPFSPEKRMAPLPS